MSKFHNLVGRPYIDGKQDCYAIIRDYYSQEWGIELPNFARPDRFWDDPEMDLYQLYKSTGFKPVLDHTYEVGDALLIPVLASINNHAAVVVDDNEILHHLPNQLSSLERLRPKWANRVMVHLRHPQITAAREAEIEVVHLHEVIDADILRNPGLQAEIEKALEPERGTVRGHHPGAGGRGEAEPLS